VLEVKSNTIAARRASTFLRLYGTAENQNVDS
jgi:hypothetical protein